MNIDAPLKNQIPQLRALWREAFDDTDEFLDAFGTTAFSTQRCLCVSMDNKIVAALYWFDCLYRDKPVAYLYSVATAKAYRGQGICHSLMEYTHTHLTAQGYEGVILVPGNQNLFEFYHQMGYEPCSTIHEFDCLSTAPQIPIRQIDKKEYATLRRQLLPKDGVLQEKENLDFLQTQVSFYAGSNFLLAARMEKDTLYGIELLGEQTNAPGILHSLGYEKGIFRTPGGDLPFAMYLPLDGNQLPPPKYFGLAFD